MAKASRSFLVLSVIATLAVAGCKKPKPAPPPNVSDPVGVTTLTSASNQGPKASPRIEGILARLKSPDEITRDNAMKELLRLKRADLELEDSLSLVNAATKTYPKPSSGTGSLPSSASEKSVAANLIRAAANDARKEHVRVIDGIYSALDPLARSEALALLSRIDDREAVESFVRHVQQDVQKGRTVDVRGDSLDVAKHHASVLFPALMKHAKGRAAGGIFAIAIALLEQDALQPETLAPYAGEVVDAWNDLKTKAGKDRYEERRHATYALDLMAWLPKGTVDGALKEALKLDDPLLNYWGAVGLVTHGQRVPAKQLEAIAAHPELRGYLFDRLALMRVPGFFPAKFRNQKALAEADMARFIEDPAQAAKAPDAIELVDVVSERSGGVVYDLYVFRFRLDAPSPLIAAGRSYEWMAGVAGPFRRGVLSTRALGETSSTFKPFVEKTVEEHKAAAKTQLHEWIVGDGDGDTDD